MGIINWFGRKKAPAPEAKLPKLQRVTVHTPDGRNVVHLARSRIIRADGSLSLCSGPKGENAIADYAPRSWDSCSVGKRAVSRGN